MSINSMFKNSHLVVLCSLYMARFPSLVLLLLCAAGATATAQMGGDLQAQIMYAYRTEDTNQLTNLIQSLGTQVQAGAASGALRYHLAHAEYRFGLLVQDRNARAGEEAFGQCAEQLKAVLEQDAGAVEALALQSACWENLARFRKLQAVLLRARAAACSSSATRLEPRNPRVVYLRAVDELAHSKPASRDYQRGFSDLKLAADLFEQTSATSIEVPGWGDAEAYLELGRQLQAAGDFLGARNWIEKSLIAAPDFKAAQRQRDRLVRP